MVVVVDNQEIEILALNATYILRSRVMCLKQLAAPWVVGHGLF
jgi:hypothetical protein